MRVNTYAWLINTLVKLWEIRSRLGDEAARELGTTDMGKRQTQFEYHAVRDVFEHLLERSALQAEGWKFDQPSPTDVDWIIGLDPTDGTAGDARFRGVGVLQSSLPVSLVLTIRRNIPDSTFASVEYAGILDLRSGQIFVAREQGATTLKEGVWLPLERKPQYNQHAPAVGWEVARRALAPIRFLIPYEVYPEMYSDSNSSAMVMLWSLLGYCDVWFNCELPGIQGAGQRGHELGAAVVFARALGACAIHTKAEGGQIIYAQELDNTPYSFDSQTSIILGVDEYIVRHYLSLMNETLNRSMWLLGYGCIPAHAFFALMYHDIPGTKWSLPLVTRDKP